MSGIETSIMPLVSTIGFGGIVGFLVGFVQLSKRPVIVLGEEQYSAEAYSPLSRGYRLNHPTITSTIDVPVNFCLPTHKE
jgi:hypothetical protein